jgi:hypothetical protein
MRLNGQWVLNDGGTPVPTIEVAVRAADGSWLRTPFLVDTGADVTTYRYDLLFELDLEPEPDDGTHLVGVGGEQRSVRTATALRITRDDGLLQTLNGTYHAFTDPGRVDISVLGRDVLRYFAVIVDRPGDQVLLLRDNDRYQVVIS